MFTDQHSFMFSALHPGISLCKHDLGWHRVNNSWKLTSNSADKYAHVKDLFGKCYWSVGGSNQSILLARNVILGVRESDKSKYITTENRVVIDGYEMREKGYAKRKKYCHSIQYLVSFSNNNKISEWRLLPVFHYNTWRHPSGMFRHYEEMK